MLEPFFPGIIIIYPHHHHHFVVLWIKPKALHILGKDITIELHTPPVPILFSSESQTIILEIKHFNIYQKGEV